MKKIQWLIFLLGLAFIQEAVGALIKNKELGLSQDIYLNRVEMQKDSIDWQWDDSDMGGQMAYQGGRLVFLYQEDPAVIRIIREDTQGKQTSVWQRPESFANAASLVVLQDTLFVALYAQTATGCQLVALDISSGNLIWEKSLVGLGSIGHSRYQNRVQLRFLQGKLVAFGWESEGKYLEVLDSKDGHLISSRKVD